MGGTMSHRDTLEMLTVREAALQLGLSESCLRAWLFRRRIASVRLGRSVRIPAREIQRLIEAGSVPAIEQPRPKA